MTNVQRVKLSDEVAEAVEQATGSNGAFALLSAASDYYLATQREMTLAEALQSVGEVAAGIEALYRRFDHA